MKTASHGRKAEARRIETLLRTGREVSIAPPDDAICRPCLWIAVFCATLSFPLLMALGKGPWIVKGPVCVLAVAYVILNFLRDSGEYGGAMTRVVLADRHLLFKPYSKYVFERLDLRHAHRVSVRRTGARATVLCIRIDYRRPGERESHLEFVPAAQYRFDAQDGNPLRDEIDALMKEARASGRFGGGEAPAVDRPAKV